jgi:hypothetical protein
VDRSAIFLQNVATGELVEADLFDSIADTHLEAWRTTWLPEVKAAKQRLLDARLPAAQWPHDLHWEWDAKVADARATFLARKSFGIICGGELQGLMLVDLTRTGRIPSQIRKELVYVDFLSTAPWNRKELACTPRYRGVGRALILAAVELSMQEEFRGRIALHSLPSADEFYRDKCGLTPLGKDPKYENLTYFEMTPEQAMKFRAP